MSAKTEILSMKNKPLILIGLLMTFLGLDTSYAFINKSASTDYGFLNKNRIELLKNTRLEFKEILFKKATYEKQLYPKEQSFVPITNNFLQDTSKTKKILRPNKGSTNQQKQRIVTTEIDALVLDATFSLGGYDFYKDFSQNFTPPTAASGYMILVKEYPGRGTNIVIAVEVNGKQLVFRRMRPVYSEIHSLSIAVSNYLNGYLARGGHLSGVDADGNFIDVQQTNTTRQIKTPFDVY